MVTLKKQSMEKQVGRYSFLAGLIVSVMTGIFTDLLDPQIVTVLLLVLGLLVGFLNITAGEFTEFLIAGIALSLVVVPSQMLQKVAMAGPYLEQVLLHVNLFVSMAVLIVALKAIWELAEG